MCMIINVHDPTPRGKLEKLTNNRSSICEEGFLFVQSICGIRTVYPTSGWIPIGRYLREVERATRSRATNDLSYLSVCPTLNSPIWFSSLGPNNLYRAPGGEETDFYAIYTLLYYTPQFRGQGWGGYGSVIFPPIREHRQG